jgi:hypothetical protein
MALIFQISVPCDKTFSWILKNVTLTLVFDRLIFQTLKRLYLFEWYELRI